MPDAREHEVVVERANSDGWWVRCTCGWTASGRYLQNVEHFTDRHLAEMEDSNA